jgi:hypothetical protein
MLAWGREMTGQHVYAASKKKYLGLWFAGGNVVVAVVLCVVFGVVKEEPPVVDDTLAAGLLDSADLAPGSTSPT